jgi:hypothetical protein
MISFQLLYHPLPWAVVEDWTFEVTAKDGTVIVKTPTVEEARRVIEIAVEVDRLARAYSDASPIEDFCPEAPHG